MSIEELGKIVVTNAKGRLVVIKVMSWRWAKKKDKDEILSLLVEGKYRTGTMLCPKDFP